MAYASSSRHTNTHLPRESIYPQAPSSDFLLALEDCVQATEGCSRTLQGGITKFEPGIRELPRLTRIMEHKHHFLVLPNPTIVAHKTALASSLAPQIDQLIGKAEQLVEGERAKVGNLEERLRIIQSARQKPTPLVQPSTNFSRTTKQSTDTKEVGTDCKITNLNMKELSIMQRKKVMQLKQKRERLEREKARLES